MKKATKISLIVAATCIGAGIVLTLISCIGGRNPFTIGFNIGGSDGFVKHDFITSEHSFNDAIENINIYDISSDIKIIPSESDKTKVICNEYSDFLHTIYLKDGTLHIKSDYEKNPVIHISIFGFGGNNFNVGLGEKSTNITLELPQKEYNMLKVRTTSGDISVSGINAENMELKTTSGDFKITSSELGTLITDGTSSEIELTNTSITNKYSSKTISGDIILNNCETSDLDLATTSGEFKLKNVNAGNINTVSTSGDTEINSSTAKNFDIKGQSSEIDIKDTTFTGIFRVKTVSGEVNFSHCDAETFDIETISGDIYGSLMTEKSLDIYTISGNIDAPPHSPDGTSKIKTVSGNIDISYVK